MTTPRRPRKITGRDRARKGIEIIVDISENAALSPAISHKQNALDAIYRLAHTIASPSCRKNHPDWVKPIDEAIRSSRSGGGKK